LSIAKIHGSAQDCLKPGNTKSLGIATKPLKISKKRLHTKFIFHILQMLNPHIPRKLSNSKNGTKRDKILPELAGYICSYRNGKG
jgi:hypothetical protein